MNQKIRKIFLSLSDKLYDFLIILLRDYNINEIIFIYALFILNFIDNS